MEAIRHRLAALPFFSGLGAAALDDISARGVWQSISGGWELFAENAPSEELCFNLSGRLIVVRNGEDGEQVVGYIRAGEPAGEMSMLSGEPHSASVFALRDTEILALARRDVEMLTRKHGDFASAIARVILHRARRPKLSFRQSAPRIFAVIGTSRSLDVDGYAKKLARRIEKLGLKARWMPVGEAAPPGIEFDDMEKRHDIILLASRMQDTPWHHFVLRHADRFLVLARRDARPPRPFPLTTEAGARARKFRLVDLVMIHEGLPACEIADWVGATSAERVVNCWGRPCLDRLARIIAGKSVGLVLSGGGARAYAHIGAVRALREAGVPVDFVCGASMGAVVAACIAKGWDDQEIERRIQQAFVSSNPLGDHVLPVVSLTKGRRVEDRLLEHFGDSLIEELPIPFFCVSSDIAAGELHVHRDGRLRDALRASIALPGILPPVVEGDALLVDGAVINNFPTDIMASAHQGLTIGIDVARRGGVDIEAFRDPPGFFAWIAEHGFSEAPPIVSLLMRTATARHERMLKVHPADIMIAPGVSGVELRDWKKYEAAVADGYAATKAAIAENADALADVMA